MSTIIELTRALNRISARVEHFIRNDSERVNALNAAIIAINHAHECEYQRIDEQCRADRVLFKATHSSGVRDYSRSRIEFTADQKRGLKESYLKTLISLHMMYLA